MNITKHQAKYFALNLNAKKTGDEKLDQSIFDAQIEPNPHQIEAALFAMKESPMQEGVILADEVGLGKTIEASLVICQKWAEGKRNLIVVCPASIRVQWAMELFEKFGLPTLVVDSQAVISKNIGKKILIMSYDFARRAEHILFNIKWDLVIIDEAHKIKNAYQKQNKTGQAIKRAFEKRKKILLTATPFHNSLMELYGLLSILGEELFDKKAFKRKFISSPKEEDLQDLKERLQPLMKRTLRKNVLEYIKYTKRQAITQNYTPSDAEHQIYEEVNDFLARENLFSIDNKTKHLVVLIIRKMLGSSPQAIIGTFTTIKERLIHLRQSNDFQQISLFNSIYEDDELDIELKEDEEFQEAQNQLLNYEDKADLNKEIATLDNLITKIQNLKTDSKANALIEALKIGFEKMHNLGANQKALIFTESRKTQWYLFEFLTANGYQADDIVLFSGQTDEHSNQIYKKWLENNQDNKSLSNSDQANYRTALLEQFQNNSKIMIATEAGAEGLNLQYCSLVINYDLPWNPQRIEQRIGRCHRYGQAFDVVVINLLNTKNYADARILELLNEKFSLFDGLFGASDSILGKVESGIDFEKRVNKIFDTCRTEETIAEAFDELQKELEDQIKVKLSKTGQKIIENLDTDVQARLNMQKLGSKTRLDKITASLWMLTQFALEKFANFDNQNKTFLLHTKPILECQTGNYVLPTSKQNSDILIYRISSDLGRWCIEQGLKQETVQSHLLFKYDKTEKMSIIEDKLGQSGWLALDKITFTSKLTQEEILVFSAITDDGEILDNEFCQKMFSLKGLEQNLSDKTLPEQLRIHQNKNLAKVVENTKRINEEEIMQESLRLDKWQDEQLYVLNKELDDTKKTINLIIKQKQQIDNIEKIIEFEEKLQILYKEKSEQRRNLEKAEDEIAEQREQIIAKMKAEINQTTATENIFAIRFTIK